MSSILLCCSILWISEFYLDIFALSHNATLHILVHVAYVFLSYVYRNFCGISS